MPTLEQIASMTKEQQLATFSPFYGTNPAVIEEQIKRRLKMIELFKQRFGVDSRTVVSEYRAPGRIEIIGNHNDHQLDPVLCAAIDDDVIIFSNPTNNVIFRIIDVKYSQPGKPIEYVINLAKGPASKEESLKRKDKLEKLFCLADGVVAGFLEETIKLAESIWHSIQMLESVQVFQAQHH